MSDKDKIRELARLTGWPIRDGYDEPIPDEWQFPHFQIEGNGSITLWRDDNMPEDFDPINDMNHAVIVANRWCLAHDYLFRLEGPSPFTATVEPNEFPERNDLLAIYTGSNSAAALSEAILLAEKARVKS